jgi:hypothetical protein
VMPIPTKIRAVREDPSAPILECYADDPAVLAKFFASRSTTTSSTKGKPYMSLNPEYVTAAAKPKRAVMGVGANYNVSALIGTLQRLELCPSGLAEPLKQLAAAGQPLAQYYQVSVWDLDRALSDVDCSVSQRLQFKSSLDRAGLLTVPK